MERFLRIVQTFFAFPSTPSSATGFIPYFTKRTEVMGSPFTSPRVKAIDLSAPTPLFPFFLPISTERCPSFYPSLCALTPNFLPLGEVLHKNNPQHQFLSLLMVSSPLETKENNNNKNSFYFKSLLPFIAMLLKKKKKKSTLSCFSLTFQPTAI